MQAHQRPDHRAVRAAVPAHVERVELDPAIRKGGDTGLPTVLAGEQSVKAKSFYELARKITAAAMEHGAKAENVIQIT